LDETTVGIRTPSGAEAGPVIRSSAWAEAEPAIGRSLEKAGQHHQARQGDSVQLENEERTKGKNLIDCASISLQKGR
jgi:hypothetical protein